MNNNFIGQNDPNVIEGEFEDVYALQSEVPPSIPIYENSRYYVVVEDSVQGQPVEKRPVYHVYNLGTGVLEVETSKFPEALFTADQLESITNKFYSDKDAARAQSVLDTSGIVA